MGAGQFGGVVFLFLSTVIVSGITAIVMGNNARHSDASGARIASRSAPISLAELWNQLSHAQRTEIAGIVVGAVRDKAKTIPHERSAAEYVQAIEQRIAQEPAATARSIPHAMLDVIRADHKGNAALLREIDLVEMNHSWTEPAGSPSSAKSSRTTVRQVASTSKDYEEIIRLTLETVYEQGTGWIPKTRSPSEYLREIERRYSESAAKTPIHLSQAVLQIVRADCEGYANVIAAVDRASKIEPTMDAVLFQEATT